MTDVAIPKCPSCGADLNVTGDGPARCVYCQKDVLVSGSPVASTGPLQNLIPLARAATDAGNDEEASTLWTRVLEQDPKNAEAWLGKAKAVPMTIGGMLAGYAQAESYCEKAKECAADGDGGAYAVLSGLLDVMTRAAEDHFEEFAEVDGAGGEFMERVFFILDARERLAGPENNPVEYQAASALCDKMLAHPVIAGVSGLSKEFKERRARYLAKGGPLLAQVRAELGAGDTPDKTKLAGAERPARLVALGVALVLIVIAIVGFGRWPGRRITTATPMSTGAAIPFATPATASTAWAPGGTEVHAARLPQTVSFPGVIDVNYSCRLATTISAGGRQVHLRRSRWVVVVGGRVSCRQ